MDDKNYAIKVSVIVPVYNEESYLPAMLDSVLAQTCKPFEIILLNDGSSDDSLNICRRYAAGDKSIKVADKPNSGVSDTRNSGMEMAAGDYVCFLDADDLIHPQYLEELCRIVREYGYPDLVGCWYASFYNHAQFPEIKPGESEVSDLSGKSCLEAFRYLGDSCCCKLFKASLLKEYKISFDEGLKHGEDFFFSLKYFLTCKSVYFTPQRLYYYRSNDEGATAIFHPDIFDKYKAAFGDILSFASANGFLSGALKNDIDIMFARRLPTFLRMAVRNRCGLGQKRKQLSAILDDTGFLSGLNEDSAYLQDDIYKWAKRQQIGKLIVYGYFMEMKRRATLSIKQSRFFRFFAMTK